MLVLQLDGRIRFAVNMLTFFEEESDLVARFQEVAIADMVALLASRELGHGVFIQREVIEQPVRLMVQPFYLFL